MISTKDFLESAAAILKRITGCEFRADWMSHLGVRSTLVPLPIWLDRSIRRRQQDFKAIASEPHYAAGVINYEMRGELGPIVERFSRIDALKV